MLAKFCILVAIGYASTKALEIREDDQIQGLDVIWPDDQPLKTLTKKEKEPCTKGYYFNTLSAECEPCSDCKEFMYIRKECTPESNTQCGWCGSKTIVRNENFLKKCESFSMFQEFRKKLISEFEARKGEDYEEYEDNEEEYGYKKIRKPVFNGKILTIQRPDLDKEDRDDFTLAEEEDFMKKPVVIRKNLILLTANDMELSSIEDELPPLADGDESEIPSEEKEEDPETDENYHVQQAENWEEELKIDIERQMMNKQLDKGMSEEIEDGTVIEIKPPKSSESGELEITHEIEYIPLNIVVTGDIEKEVLISEQAKDESSSEENEDDEEDDSALVQEELRMKNTRRMVRFVVMSITFILMCWIFISYREKRRRRAFIIPPLDNLTPEQNTMINRCICETNGKKANFYENPIAYV